MDENVSLELMTKKQGFLEHYASKRRGATMTNVMIKSETKRADVELWLRTDETFRTQFDLINQRRIDRSIEMFKESIESVAENLIMTAQSDSKNSVRATQLIFNVLGISKTDGAVVAILNKTDSLVINTQSDVSEAKRKAEELDAIIRAASEKK